MWNVTVSSHNSTGIAQGINESVESGDKITVNGHTPVKAYGQPAARSWNNGSVSIRVAAKAAGKFNDIYFKAGTEITVLPA